MFLLVVVVLVVVVSAETKAPKSTQLARVPSLILFFESKSVGVSCTLCTSASLLINDCRRRGEHNADCCGMY